MTSCPDNLRCKLEACTYKNTVKYNIDGDYWAFCVKVYDGDTATFAFCLTDDRDPCKESCRFIGYNSAEIRSKDPVEKDKAICSRDYLKELIYQKVVRITIKGFDKYGRPLVEVYTGDTFVNELMVELGFGKPYDGTGEKTY